MASTHLLAAGLALLSLPFGTAGATPAPHSSPHSPFADQYTLFESGQVRPLALSADREYLFVLNTPDNRLEVFKVRSSSSQPLQQVGSVRVGLEPVAVAVRNGGEVWVVNHLSDSVSVVDVSSPDHPFVAQTLLVGDEPRDLVFAGHHRRRAFVTTAHRGQNSPIDPQLTTPGVGRADVWVFDAGDPGDGPITILSFFADTPRALAASPDGSKVYAAAFHSGNRTTTLEAAFVTDGGPAAPDGHGLPLPVTNFQGLPQPEDGLIVKFDGSHWRDHATGRVWDDLVKFNLPDYDVFTIDANANPPAAVPGGSYSGVGTILYNMAVNPKNGKVYVSNTEARNEVRFEGPGIHGGSTVRGHLHEARITVLGAGGAVTPRHLNKHIDYAACCAPIPNAENAKSLSQPVEMVFSGNGNTVYVAAFGSGKIGVFSSAALENDTFVPSAASHIDLSGGGPTGLALDESRHRIYVLTRFDNTVSVVDTVSRNEMARRPLFNPEPQHVKAGRSFLFDARRTASNGESACGSCHVFGDLDSLAWDLGNPDAEVIPNPGPLIDATPIPGSENFQPMKGPMTTQSLRGMANHGPMHWRGDRNGNNEVVASAQPDTGIYDERQAFREFNPAFEELLGGPSQLSAGQMEALTDYVLELTYPPNPIRNLDNSLTPSQARGRAHFFQEDVTVLNPINPSPLALTSCNHCHRLDPAGNQQFGVAKPGFFGSTGLGMVDTGSLQHAKVPHLRNLYQKVGMFGVGALPFLPPDADYSHQGDQIRGFGFIHNGGVDSVDRFLSVVGFSNLQATGGFNFTANEPRRADVGNFLMAFDSNLAPIVGQQITLHRFAGPARQARASLLLERAAAGECEVVASVSLAGQERSFLYLSGDDLFVADEQGLPPFGEAWLRLAALVSPVTYTAVPPGSGQRIGLDADLDGCFDGTETRRGYDPRNPASRPPGCS